MLIYIKDAIMFLCAIFKEYWYLIIGIIALCFLLPIFVKYLYALVSRVAFVVKLSSACRKKGAIPGGSPTTLNYSETEPRKISLSLPMSVDNAQSVLLFQPSAVDVRVLGGNDVDSKGNYCGYRIFDGEEFINYLFRI